MGWTSCRSWTRDSIVEMLTRPWSGDRKDGWRADYKVLHHHLIHEDTYWCLWMVSERTMRKGKARLVDRSINLALLSAEGGAWGYKDLNEAMFPYYSSCPLSFLDLVPAVSHQWRECVHAYHAERVPAGAITVTSDV